MLRIPSKMTSRILASFLALGAGAGHGQDDDLAKELPRIKATEPADAPATIRLHPGFRLHQTAIEPVVTDPVAACYDADGRLYTVEMRGYPYPEGVAPGGISLLEDTDGDGRYEKRSQFVGDLSWPTGIVPYDGGVFIAAAPDILYAKDADGDGVADVNKKVFTGFGTQNVQGLLNGLLWGPDGWIYGAAGSNGGEIKNLTKPDAPVVSVRGRDFRFRPEGDGFVLEATTGGVQFGHAFDDWGHRFVCSNSNHIREIVLPAADLARNPAFAAAATMADIAVEGPAGPVFRISPPEPWRVVRTRQRTADPAFVKRSIPSELHAAGFFTSATGVTIYRGSAFPAEYRGNVFVGDVGGNLVHRKFLERAGSILRARRADEGVEFLASTDNWFRPVNFANTPAGTLLVLDMYRETIEHPASIPEPIKKHLDLTSGHDRGRLYEILPAEGFNRRARPALAKAPTAELVPLLADPDAWWRETAQRLLIERNDKSAIPALKELAHGRPTALARYHALWTLEVLGGLENAQVVEAMSDPEPGVREQAAKLAQKRAAGDPAVRDGLVTLAGDPEGLVRLQVALALGDVPDPKAVEALAAIAAKDSADPWIRGAVLSSIAGRTGALIDALAANPGFFGTDAGKSWLGDLAILVGIENRGDQVESLLKRFAAADPGQARAAILGLGLGLQRSGGSFRALLDGPAAKQLKPLFENAGKVAADDDNPPGRADAIRLLGLGPIDPALEILPPLLDARQPVAIQLAALQTLADLADTRVGPAILEHWKGIGPSVRREAVEAMFARADRLEVLLEALEARAITPADLDPGRRKTLLTHPSTPIRERAAKLLAGEATSDRGKVIAEYKAVLELEGDPARGQEVHKKSCATCHRAAGAGIQVGPDLSTVTGRTPEDLLVHILDPNREVASNYANYVLITTDGRTASGLIAEESAGAVTLKRSEGTVETIPRARIEEIATTGQSLMPEGLEKEIDKKGMADLIAFIRSLTAVGAGVVPAPAPGR
jgi:putative membrane-bound dehydrogenase-like protein